MQWLITPLQLKNDSEQTLNYNFIQVYSYNITKFVIQFRVKYSYFTNIFAQMTRINTKVSKKLSLITVFFLWIFENR